jgi:hypothetical protein
MSGADVQALVRRIHATPKPVLEVGRQLSSGK